MTISIILYLGLDTNHVFLFYYSVTPKSDGQSDGMAKMTIKKNITIFLI